MLAVTRATYGGPEVIRIKEIIKPVPRDNELLVKVHATTVSRTDCGGLTGKPLAIRAFIGLFSPNNHTLGTDFSGEVVGLGKKVRSFSIGDRVWGLNDEGLLSQAQYMTIAEDKAVLKIPENVSFASAAASAEGAHYAYNTINKVKIEPGDKVLVNGATGAIGSATVQILKHIGAYVTAVGNTKNMDLLSSLGADKTWNYEKEDFTKDRQKYSFVFDTVGKSRFHYCKKIMDENGIYISSELGPHAENLYLPITTKFTSRKKVRFPLPFNCKRSLVYMQELMAAGKFKAVIDKKYEMSEAASAYRYVMSGQKTGNVILMIDQEQ